MAGLDSTAQAQPRHQTPQRRSNLSSFPAPRHLHICIGVLLVEMHDPRPATAVRTASKIGPSHNKINICSSLGIGH
jgi:hypothetical protein